MTQKEIEMLLANTKVYVNGKSREIQEKLFSLGYKWNSGSTDVSNIGKPFLYIYERKAICHGDDMEYFIKGEYREITAEQILSLEVTKPSYRPFRNKEECWEETLKHQPCGWIKNKFGDIFNIVALLEDEIKLNECYSEYSELSKDYMFMDGTPFGIKEE